MFDYAVIGSGVSGGRMAWSLTEGGAKCVLLEAGRHFTRANFPGNELDASSQMYWGGGLELTDDGRLGLLRGKCVGGTSVLNQALLDRFDAFAWDLWREKSGITAFNQKEMEPVYLTIEKSIELKTIAESQFNKNAKLFQRALKNLEIGLLPLRRAHRDCAWDRGSDCIVCLGGCPRDSKQSTLVASIPKALAAGLTLESEFEVHNLHDHGDHVEVFGKTPTESKKILARKVILAAGSLGNTRILFQSPQFTEVPALGKGFYCHPQFMTYGLFDETVNAHKGCFQSLKSYDPKMREKGFKLENVFAPPIGTAMLMPGLGVEHLRLMENYRSFASIEVALRDETPGTIKLAKNGSLVIDKKLSGKDREKAKDGVKLVQHLFESVGARKIISCPQAFGLHLMGGCSIGMDPAKNVVSPEFHLHESKNIFCADSSVFPAAPGINPSLTIMALTHLAAGRILRS